MPFGLKNTEATYQRMITRMFTGELGKTVEVYIDDMVVKISWQKIISVTSGLYTIL
jgi:hypothetical protein